MSKFLRYLLLCSTALLLLSLPSCEKFDGLKEDWRPSLAAPLLFTSIDVYDILNKSDADDLVIINENTGLLALSYRGELVSAQPAEIVDLPDQSATFTINSPVPLMPISGTVTESATITQSLVPNGTAEITKIVFSSGKLIYSLGSSFGGSGGLDLNIVSLVKEGVVYQKSIGLNTLDTLDLAGYELDLSKTAQEFNEFTMNLTATLTGSAGTPIPSPMATMSIDMIDLDFEVIYGDFKTAVVSADVDSILVKVFGELKDVGQITFTDPKIRLIANNSFGFPVRVTFDSIYSTNVISGENFELVIDPNSSSFDIDYPSASRLGDSVQSSITFNPTNSTVDSIVSPTPKWLVSKITGSMNPDGIPAENHLHKDAFLKISTELELPLEGRVFNYVFQDTTKYNFSENIEEIDSILIRTSIQNGFPIDASVQVYITDENYNITDSIFPSFDDNIIASGTINSKGRVSEPVTKITDVTFQQSRVPNITNASYLITRMSLKTSENGDIVVKIFDDYEITLKMGMKIDGQVPLGDE